MDVASMSKIGRNAPCPCGSGKKYKKCCLKNEQLSRNLEKLGDIAEAMCFYGQIEDEDLKFVNSLKGTSNEKLKILCDSVLSYPLNSGDLTTDDYTAISASLIDRDRAGFYESFAFLNDFSENTDVAEDLYDKSIELYNKHGDHYDVARVLTKKAMMQFDLGRHGEAIALLKEATEIGDDVEGEAGNFVNLGLVYSDMGDYKTALDCYKKALRIFDRLGDAEQKRNIYKGMAEAYKMLGDEEAGKLYMDKAGIEEGIEEAEISHEEERLILKINLLVKRGKIEKAIETCAENPDFLSEIAGSFAMQDHIMAEKFLRKMVEKFPFHGRSHYNLGLYLRENGEIEEAEKEYRKCIELDPAYLDTYINLGNILNMEGKNEEAEKILNRGIELGEDPLLFHALGNVYASTNRFDDAENMYKKSLGMGYSFAKYGLDALKEKRAGGQSGSGRRIWVSTPYESKRGEMTKREFAQFAGFRNLREYEKEARKAQRETREKFIEFFGSDELICDDGEELADKLNEFYYWYSRERKDETGKTPAQKWEEDKGTPAPRLNIREGFPEDLLKEEDVAMIFDKEEGQCILTGYSKFFLVFSDPDVYLEEYGDIVKNYLVEESISPLVFYRMAVRYPENTQKVLREVLGRPDFNLTKLDDLMWEFKPKAMEHWGEPTVHVFKV